LPSVFICHMLLGSLACRARHPWQEPFVVIAEISILTALIVCTVPLVIAGRIGFRPYVPRASHITRLVQPSKMYRLAALAGLYPICHLV